MKSPNDLPVYARIANKLVQQSRKSSGPSSQPSVRDVARQFSVSIVTASRALHAYRDKLARASTNGSTKPGGRWAVCLNVTPAPHQLQRAAGEPALEGFRRIALADELDFDFNSINFLQETTEEAFVEKLTSNAIRGLYLLPSRLSDATLKQDETLLAACAKLQIPAVLIERGLRGADQPLRYDVVTLDDFAAGRITTRHLLRQNRQKIAFITASPTSSHVERVGGYLSAMNEERREPLILQYPNELSAKAAYMSLVDELQARGCDGVICYHDYPAFGLLMEFLRRGVSVPQAIGIVGFDNMPIGDSYTIGMTTYAFPGDKIARRAVELMNLRLATPQADPVRLIVPGELLIRDSTFDSSALT